jgi:putative transposase
VRRRAAIDVKVKGFHDASDQVYGSLTHPGRSACLRREGIAQDRRGLDAASAASRDQSTPVHPVTTVIDLDAHRPEEPVGPR